MLLLACFSASILFSFGLAAPRVALNGTTIVGSSINFQGRPQEFFGGVPFGTAERFATAKFASLKGPTFDATAYGALCVQPTPTDFKTAEDCLTVNILRPAASDPRKHSALPVMVWIYGGSFAESQIYNGSALVANSVARGTPVIHISLNYRLGPFGFPQGQEAESRGALNLGLKDQFLALQWVKFNIAAFGGDPSKVTVYGQSAGAISIAIHHLNLDLPSVAHATIMQSGSAASLPLYDANLRAPAWQAFAAATPECAKAPTNNTFDCLRSASPATLLNSWNAASATTFAVPFVPVIDGPNGVIPALPSQLLATGRFAKIPFIAGTVLDEGTGGIPTTLDYSNQTLVLELFTAIAQPYNTDPGLLYEGTLLAFVSLYPNNTALGSPYGTGNATWGLSPEFKRYAAVIGDFTFQALRRAWTGTAAGFGVPVYAYLFADQAVVNPEAPWLGVHHATDVDYVYGMNTGDENPVKGMSTMMMDYWTSFATSLNPNDGKGQLPRINWPRYNVLNPHILQFADSLSLIPDNYRAAGINFLNTVPGIVGH